VEAFLLSAGIVVLAEMGDKTQIATVTLANAPVVWFGDAITKRVPIRIVHIVSALVFAALGVVALWP
jgi:putative Ca2+/H+ antiporter (TMEM165/GDT1 family)